MSFCRRILSLWAWNFFFLFFLLPYNGFMTPPWNSRCVESFQFSALTSQQTAHLSDGFIWIPNAITKRTTSLLSYLTIWLKPFVLLIVQFCAPPLLWQVFPDIGRDQWSELVKLIYCIKKSTYLLRSWWTYSRIKSL